MIFEMCTKLFNSFRLSKPSGSILNWKYLYRWSPNCSSYKTILAPCSIPSLTEVVYKSPGVQFYFFQGSRRVVVIWIGHPITFFSFTVVTHLSRITIKWLIVQRSTSKHTYFRVDFLDFSFLWNIVTHKLWVTTSIKYVSKFNNENYF